MDREKVINDLNVAKLILCNPQMLTPEMCIRIGQAVTNALALLKEQQFDIDALKNTIQGMVEGQCIIAGDKRTDIVRCKDCIFGEEENDLYRCLAKRGHCLVHNPDWFCADGKRKGGR